MRGRSPLWGLTVGATLVALATTGLGAQDRLKAMPAYAHYEQMLREIPSAIQSGAIAVTWTSGSTFDYSRDGKSYRYDVAAREATDLGPITEDRDRPHREPFEQPERGRQFATATSPDGRLTARYRDRNVWILEQGRERAVTVDGSAASRVKYGTASWVYGEELNQRTAMWWSPDGRKLAYYRFDESKVPDFYLTLHQTDHEPTVNAEAFPLAGAANPVVDLFVYDVATRRSIRIDVRSGHPFTDDVVGHYVYRVEWSQDSRQLLFLRTNRRQNVMEVAAADAATGACRVVVREEWPSGWLNEDPRLVFLADGKRFIWESQRTGFNNYYLYDLEGSRVTPLTHNAFEAYSLVKLDEPGQLLFYMARDGDNPMKLQLHRVQLDGTHDVRLTDPAFHHTIGNCWAAVGARVPLQMPVPGPCGISPDNRYFVDVYQTHDLPPAARVVDAVDGSIVSEIARSDTTTFDSLHLRTAELFSFMAADGQTTLRGLLEFPSTFDASKTYPLLVHVYGAPEFAADTARETFVTPSALTELGFLVVNVDSRAIPGLGKRVLDSIYLKLGTSDIDDIAEGIKSLWNRPYVDRTRVGIFGTSYGGYAALMAILRHPDVFAAASSSSPPSDWRNYDTVYTERYMWTPEANAAGYDEGSALAYAKVLKGRLLIYYGTADDNVHPTNALQLIKALGDAGKSFDVQVGPDEGHGDVNRDRMMEFFIDALKP